MTKFPTCLKYFVICFDNRVQTQIERQVKVGIFADSETEALEKAAKVVKRNQYEVYEVAELIDTEAK